MQELWIRAVIFNEYENRILLHKEDDQYVFLRSRKPVPFKASLKNQTKSILERLFNISGSEVGGVVCFGCRDCLEGIEIFVRVILKKDIELDDNYVWVADEYDIQNLNLDSETREVLEKIFNKN